MPIVHFNSLEHRKNKKDGGRRKTLVYRKSKSGKPVRCEEIRFSGTGRMVYSPENPLPCGAAAWLEITGEVELIGADTTKVKKKRT